MNFQHPRKIRPPKLALLLFLFTAFCTLFTLYFPPSIQIFQKQSSETETSSSSSIDNLERPIKTSELIENFNDSSSSSEDRKSLEDNADDAAAYNSSLSEDIKSLEEDNVHQFTSPNWPDITTEELIKKDDSKKKPSKKRPSRKRTPQKKEVSQRKQVSHKKKETDDSEKNEYPRKKSHKDVTKKENNKRIIRKQPPARVTQEFLGSLASRVTDRESCDIFSGEWIPNPDAPYYTNKTCKYIQEHQNCMKYGKPDKGYMKWKWKPDNDCQLSLFDPHQFLELLRGKSLAFVGDSVARNHMQSLICLLSAAVVPEDISKSKDENYKQFEFSDYNVTISIFWAPYLVRNERTDVRDVTQPFNLYLDEFDEYWPSAVESYDYVIISAGQWFFRPTMFYLNRNLVGCLYCPQENVNHLSSSHFGYRRAFRNAFSAINSLNNYKGVTFLRTFATSHFEGGAWDQGGDCVRTKPVYKNESDMEAYSLELYKIQLEELRIAQREGRRKGLKFRLFDATRAMSLRPDGHPGKFGHSPNQKVELARDCVHWCLPGPIDTINDFLQELITREFERSSSSS